MEERNFLRGKSIQNFRRTKAGSNSALPFLFVSFGNY